MDEDGSIIRQRVIDRDYNGDAVAYKRSTAQKRIETFRWQDIHASAVVFPEYEEEALRQIEFQLGYKPNRQVTLPYEPFVRHALYKYDFEHRNFEKLCTTCNAYIKMLVSKKGG